MLDALINCGCFAALVLFFLSAHGFQWRNRTEASPDATRWAFWRWFDIYGTGEVLYLRRLTIVRTPWFQVLLHWIHKPDPDDALHDHPWAFCTFVLKGWYVERVGKPVPGANFMLWSDHAVVRWFARKGLGDAHRIVYVGRRPAVTLVFTGPKRKSWSFYDHAGRQVPWRQFLDEQRLVEDDSASMTNG